MAPKATALFAYLSGVFLAIAALVVVILLFGFEGILLGLVVGLIVFFLTIRDPPQVE